MLPCNWGWFVALGIVQIVLGLIALGASVIVTLASVVLFGWLLMIGGILSVVHAFWERQWSGFFLDLAMGILNAVVGFMVIGNPGRQRRGLDAVDCGVPVHGRDLPDCRRS